MRPSAITARPIRATGVTVSELGFGGAPIGNLYRQVPGQQSYDALQAAWDAGIRYFDTAPHYGLGLSEARLGSFLGAHQRDEYVISTKVGRLLEPNPGRRGSDLDVGGFAVLDDLHRVRDYSADGVRRSLDASLQRLGVDRIDIVYVHDPDEFVDQAISEAVPALVGLREQGVIGAVGVGMNQWQAPLQMVTETDLDIVMIAGRWTLLDRSAAPLMQACAESGVAVAAAAPFNSGLLARNVPSEQAKFDYQSVAPQLLEQARALAAICAEHGVALPHAALQFGLRSPQVATVVAGFDRPEHVNAAVSGMAATVSQDVFTEIDSYLQNLHNSHSWKEPT